MCLENVDVETGEELILILLFSMMSNVIFKEFSMLKISKSCAMF